MTQIFSAISKGKIPAVTRVPPEDKLEIASNQPQPLTDHSILVTQSDTEAAVLTNKSKKKLIKAMMIPTLQMKQVSRTR